MDEVKQMMRAVINGQAAFRSEVLNEISKLRKEFNGEVGALRGELGVLRSEMKNGFAEVNERLDKQGSQLAYLEEDTPTHEEHEVLEKRVKKIEERLKN